MVRIATAQVGVDFFRPDEVAMAWRVLAAQITKIVETNPQALFGLSVVGH